MDIEALRFPRSQVIVTLFHTLHRHLGISAFAIMLLLFSRSLVSDSSVHHQLLELAHTHVCRVDDVILIPFFSCLQSFPASGAFPMSQFFASGGQSIGVSALASVLPMNIVD